MRPSYNNNNQKNIYIGTSKNMTIKTELFTHEII